MLGWRRDRTPAGLCDRRGGRGGPLGAFGGLCRLPRYAVHESRNPNGWPNPVVITAPAPDCSPDRPAGYVLGEKDDRHAFEAAPCQGLWVTLTRSAADGCQWTDVESSDQSVVTLIPFPLPPFDHGGTEAAFRTGQVGRASLTSTLECGSTSQVVGTWQVIVLVAG